MRHLFQVSEESRIAVVQQPADFKAKTNMFDELKAWFLKT